MREGGREGGRCESRRRWKEEEEAAHGPDINTGVDCLGGFHLREGGREGGRGGRGGWVGGSGFVFCGSREIRV